MNDEMKSIKEILAVLMDKIAAYEIRELAEDDPGPVPGGVTEVPWPVGSFDDVIDDLSIVKLVLKRVNEILIREENVIRPSVANEILAAVIDELISCGVDPFLSHEPAFREVERALLEASERLKRMTTDGDYAWRVDEVEADFEQVLHFISTQIRRFEGLWAAAMSNTVGSSFGRVTPGELMRALHYMVVPLVPIPPRFGLFSMPHPEVKGWGTPQPWAGLVRDGLKLAAESMNDVPTVEVPRGEVPYSVGGRF